MDTGAQVSLIKNEILPNQSLINKANCIKIKSLHGSEETLGEITATIEKNNIKIPIQLQVTKNKSLKEDGILGFDIIGERAVIDGPKKTLTFNTENSTVEFNINTFQQHASISKPNIDDEIQRLQNIEYIDRNEINRQYEINLRKVRTITHQINHSCIRISPSKNE